MWSRCPTDIETLSLSNYTQLCRVRSFLFTGLYQLNESIQYWWETCFTSDVCVLFAESAVADSCSHEHSYSHSQHLLKQTVYQCPLCGRLTMSLKFLLSHLAKHSLQTDAKLSSGWHRCSTCGKKFARAATLASHIDVVHRGHLYSLFLLSLICTVWCLFHIDQ